MPAGRVYLDYNATTPIDPRVLDRMHSVQANVFGNPSSRHSWGAEALKLVEEAREKVAALIGAKPRQIYFTSGATEANNLVIRGIVATSFSRDQALVSTTIEHEAVQAPLETLRRNGWKVNLLAPQSDGLITPESLDSALAESSSLFLVIGAHNEFGTIQPLKQHVQIAQKRGARVFVDGAQLVGKVPFDVRDCSLDYLTFSAHKIYGPKGVGAVYLRERPKDAAHCALLQGGGQEHEVRSGTLNVPGIVGFGEAAKIAQDVLETEGLRLIQLRDKLWKTLQQSIPNIRLNGPAKERLPGNLNFTVPGIEANAVLNLLPMLGISTGSACNSDAVTPSKALLALGLSDQDAFSTLRMSIGRFTSLEDIAFSGQELVRAYRTLSNARL